MRQKIPAEQKKLDKNAVPDPSEQFYSVEFKVKDSPYLHQYKIYAAETNRMFVFLRKDSTPAKKLRTGDVIKMRYYSHNSVYPKEVDTRIVDIRKNKAGPFKNNVSVELFILKET